MLIYSNLFMRNTIFFCIILSNWVYWTDLNAKTWLKQDFLHFMYLAVIADEKKDFWVLDVSNYFSEQKDYNKYEEIHRHCLFIED